MSTKANFTPEEWAHVAGSPMVAGIAITAAEPSGIWGLLKESMAGGWAVLEAQHDESANPLVKAVADDIADPATRDAIKNAFQERFKGSTLPDAKAKAESELQAVAEILDQKAPDDAPAFKRWLLTVAQKTAEASTEGGFLGIGGVAVSDAEKTTLDEIANILGLGHVTA
ncbi:hypothetical protein [Microvirga terricola]|uniref:Mu-like prophage I protein n=1 Tax=Microvirga terricola TaxID=2719797 RepID=A0ABX0VBH3_9HYPH|nr:hypothetical protein [Microvirga terricola]NIX77200.1 hypothetical protein [Microvirga terricola]